MKKLVTALVLIFTLTSVAQQRYGYKDNADYWYLSASFDVNKSFGLKDNPRTKIDNRGLDWDFEVGARSGHFGVYMFYGRFDKIDYQNYGTGVDYYWEPLRDLEVNLYNPFNGRRFTLFDGIEFTAGVYYSVVIRKDYDGNYGSFMSPISPKARILIWNGNVGLGLIGKYQGRAELGKKVFEGSFEIIYKFDRK